jgi:hypothetical protein
MVWVLTVRLLPWMVVSVTDKVYENWYELFEIDTDCNRRRICILANFNDLIEQYDTLKRDIPDIDLRAFQVSRHRIYPTNDALVNGVDR